jgi:hypothetical protein
LGKRLVLIELMLIELMLIELMFTTIRSKAAGSLRLVSHAPALKPRLLL